MKRWSIYVKAPIHIRNHGSSKTTQFFKHNLLKKKLDFFNSWRYFFYYCENVLPRTQNTDTVSWVFFLPLFLCLDKLLPFYWLYTFSFLENVHSHRTTGRENLINFYRHEFYIFKYFVYVNFYLINPTPSEFVINGIEGERHIIKNSHQIFFVLVVVVRTQW